MYMYIYTYVLYVCKYIYISIYVWLEYILLHSSIDRSNPNYLISCSSHRYHNSQSKYKSSVYLEYVLLSFDKINIKLICNSIQFI